MVQEEKIVIYGISAKSDNLICEKGNLGHDAEGGVFHSFKQNKITCDIKTKLVLLPTSYYDF